MKKKWFSSKTVWLNVITFVLGAISVIQQYVDAKMVLLAVGILNVALNVILRVWFTDTSIASAQQPTTPSAPPMPVAQSSPPTFIVGGTVDRS